MTSTSFDADVEEAILALPLEDKVTAAPVARLVSGIGVSGIGVSGIGVSGIGVSEIGVGGLRVSGISPQGASA
ncbi:hypothetical protein [Arthrobacter sp. ov118]|uniref:hypothetical protein n=1 Tax=Arthrobacter sp. ov118 TaxID=1761747 RepID=UPI0008F3B7A3|nr:hypothetical protein [Arthrobacter sp. ov118]SFT90573.1 hypothetical protein SAMN04487915_10521 [Arthrobacter sp. ov118]